MALLLSHCVESGGQAKDGFTYYTHYVYEDLMSLFKDFALAPAIAKALDAMGFTKPTEIQEKSLPALLGTEKVDFHGQAQTGTGQTLAFGIPLLEKIDTSNRIPQALIVAPTRELVLQICESLREVGKFTGAVIEPIYGGVSIVNQMRALKHGVHIIVGTPGRLRDHLRRKTLSLKSLNTFVLDEADIMLDMGFKEEIDEILKYAPADRQIWLFSATVKGGISQLKKSHMKDPVSVRVSGSGITTANTKQYYCIVPSKFRLQALCRVIDTAPEFYGLIFCQTKILTGDIADRLTKRGYRVGCLHGDMDQKLRTKVIKKFKDKSFDIVVATDVAARGIDVVGLTHVINYSIPEDQESYVHRVGRTGRAGKEGTAITFVSHREAGRVKQIARRFNADILEFPIPTADDVLKIRMNKALEHFGQATSKLLAAEEKISKLRTTVSESSKEELVNSVVSLLTDKYLRGHDHEKEIPSVCPTEKALQDGDKKELMLHVGLEDGINRDHVLQYCLDTDTVDQSAIERVRVIKRRSFVILSSDNAGRLVKALKGKTLLGKRVRISLVNQNEERGGGSGGRFGSRDGGGGRSRRFGSQGGQGGGGRGKRFGNSGSGGRRRAAEWR